MGKTIAPPELPSATAAKAHARTATTRTSFFIQFLLSFGLYYTKKPASAKRRTVKITVVVITSHGGASGSTDNPSHWDAGDAGDSNCKFQATFSSIV
jgi:hypothetical protein